MSNKKVEQRTVEMRFDNSQFEKNIAQSQASLAAFNEKLADIGKGAGSGIATFANSVKSISFDKVNNGLEIGIGKLATLTAMATGISKFTDKIYEKINEIVKSFSIAGHFAAGFDKYTSATESMQTIISATQKDGESLTDAMDRANKVLDELLWFSDETSYSATQMTDAIGKFASSGVELEDAKQAIEGIALWSATAGVNTKKAELAFRNLAQAMSLGALRNNDWSSLDLINITTTKFRQLALDTGVELQKLTKEGGKYFDQLGNEITTANMRSTLDSGWFDTELMTAVFKKYSEIVPKVKEITDTTKVSASDAIEQLKNEGLEAAELFSLNAFELGQEAKTLQEAIDSVSDAASSKFMEIFQVIFGNYEQAKELWTELANDLYDIFIEPLNYIVDVFKAWGKAEDGRERFINHIYKIFDNLYEVFCYFRDAWQQVFGTKATRVAKRLEIITDVIEKISVSLDNFAKKLLENEEIFENIKIFAQGIKDVIDVLVKSLKTAFSTIFKPFKGNGDAVQVVEVISRILAKIGEFLSKMANYITEHKVMEKAMEGLITIGTKVKDTFIRVVDAFKRIFATRGEHTNIIWQLGTDAVEFKNPLEIIRDILITIVDVASDLITKMTPVVGAVWSFIKAVITFLGELITGMAPTIKNAFGILTEALTTATNKMTDFLQNADFNKPLEVIKNIIGKIAGGIANFVGIIIGSINKIKEANSDSSGGSKGEKQSFLEKISNGIIKFSENLYAHKEAIEWVQTVLFGGKGASTVILDIAKSLGILFVSIGAGIALFFGIKKIFETLDKLINANPFSVITKAIGGVQSAITGFTKAMAKNTAVKMLQTVGNVILEVAAAFFILSLIPGDMIKRNAVIIGVSLALITAAVVGILMAVSKFNSGGQFDTQSAFQIIGKGGTTITGKNAGKSLANSGPLYAAVALVAAIGVACLLMATSVAIIGSLANWDSALIGFLGLTIIIGAVAGVIVAIKTANLTQKDVSPILACGVLFMAIGKAMQFMGKTIVQMANTHYDDLATAIMGMAMLLTGFAVIVGIVAVMNPNATSMAATALMILSMSVMFLAIGAAIKMAEKVDILKAWPVLLLMVGICGVLVLLVGSISILTKGIAKSISSVAPMAMLAVIISSLAGMFIALGAAIAIIASVAAKGGDIEGASKALLAIMGLIGVIITVFALLSSGMNGMALAKNMTTLLMAVGGLSLAILIISGALVILSKVDTNGIWAAVGALAALFAVIMIGAGLLTIFPALQAGLLVLAQSLVFISAAVVGFSTGILLVALAVKIICDSFAKIVELGPAAAEQITSIMKAIGTGIVDIFKGIANGFIEMFKTFLDNRATLFEYAGSMMGVFIQALLTAVPAFLNVVQMTINKVFEIVLTLLYQSGPGLIEFINETITEVLFYIVKLIGELLPEVNKTLNEVLTDAVTNLCELLVKAIPTINETINILVINVTKCLLEQILKVTDVVLDALDTLADALLIKLPILTAKFTAIGVELMVAWIVGMIVGIMKSIPLFVEEGSKAFIEMVDKLCAVIEEQREALADAFIKLIETALKAVGYWAGRLYAMTKKGGGQGILHTIGGYLTDGLQEGILSQRNKDKLFNAGKQVYSYYGNGIRSASRMASPSKEEFEKGVMLVQGLLNGVKDKLPDVKASGENLYNTFSSSFGGALNSIADRFKGYGSKLMGNLKDGLFGGNSNMFSGLMDGNTFEGLMNLNPTITPSLDLSKITSQSKGIDDLLGNKQVKSISDINDWSSGQITLASDLRAQDAVETKGMFKDMQNKMTDLLHVETYNAQKETNVNVELKGDAKGLFDMVLFQDKKQLTATGISHMNSAADSLKKIKNAYFG